MISGDISNRIKLQSRPLTIRFSTAQVDLMLIHKILHECAEILWTSLPEATHTRWMTLFPLDSESENSGVYLRNLLRIHTEHIPENDRVIFFASETFSDVMALYWMETPPELHQSLSGDLVPRFRSFLDDVMEECHHRREEFGSAFIRK